MTKLTIIYRVCDSVDLLHTTASEGPHDGNKFSNRFYDVPKAYLIQKCLASVKDVMRIGSELEIPNNIPIEFICVHDNCSAEMIDYVKREIPDAKMVKCDGSGNGDSFATCVEIANKIVDDDTLVLFLEDDYTFLSQNGLVKGVMMLETVSARKKEKCALFLDDYPDRYDELGERKKTDVIVTPYGHVMRIDSSTCSFMTYAGVVKAHYGEFIKFKEYPNALERDSIDLVWKDVPLYCPIPGITLHCQLKSHVPQYMDAYSLKSAFEGVTIWKNAQ